MIAPHLEQLRSRLPRSRRASWSLRAPRSPPAVPGTAAGSRRGATSATARASGPRARANRPDRRARRRASPTRSISAASTSSLDPARRVLRDQRRRSLAEGAGRDLLRQRLDAGRRRAAPRSRPCCRRSATRSRALPSTRSSALRIGQRRRQPQDLDRVERRVHARAKWCRPVHLQGRCPRPPARRGSGRRPRNRAWPWPRRAQRCALR